MIEVTQKTTLDGLQDLMNQLRERPDKPTSFTIKFFGGSGGWNATMCMPGGPVIGHGRDMVAAINDALRKASI